jgi:hypothetical protein
MKTQSFITILLLTLFSVGVANAVDPRFPTQILGPYGFAVANHVRGNISINGTKVTLGQHAGFNVEHLPLEFRFSVKAEFSKDANLRVSLTSNDEWEPVRLEVMAANQTARLGTHHREDGMVSQPVPILLPNQPIEIVITVIGSTVTATFNGQHPISNNISAAGIRVIGPHSAGGTIVLDGFSVHAK